MSRTIPTITKELLIKLYIEESWSIQKIADHYGCNNETIRKRLKKYDVPRRAVGSPKGPKSPEHTEKLRQHMSQLHKGRTGSEHPGWKGGHYRDSYGYVLVRVDGKTKKEHRYIMEQHLGRQLGPLEVVHHINGDKTDNRIENLELFGPSNHVSEHWNNEKRGQMADYWQKRKDVRP